MLFVLGGGGGGWVSVFLGPLHRDSVSRETFFVWNLGVPCWGPYFTGGPDPPAFNLHDKPWALTPKILKPLNPNRRNPLNPP